MSLPEITLPAGIPIFLAEGHSATPRSKFADVGMRTGHSRKRRVSTAAPRVVQVSLFLTAELMQVFDTWFEDTLVVGVAKFSAQVAQQGAKTRLWWEAEWVDMPRSEPLAPDAWRVTGRLLLTGIGSVDGPLNSSARVEFGAALTGVARTHIDQFGAIEFGAALEQVI